MKKILSIFLSLVLVIGLIPSPVFALPDGVSISNYGADNQTPLPSHLLNGQIWTDKSVSYVGDGIFDITLKAIGQSYEIDNPLTRDLLDVVLVLDTSGSMDDDDKLESMQAAATNAVNTLLNVVGNRVAIIEYNEYASLVSGFTSNAASLIDDIDDLEAGGGTNIQHAFYDAHQLIKNRPSNNDDRKPVIILMSDGRPTYYYDGLYTSTSTRLGNGQANNTSGAHVWNTVLQAMSAKNDASIENLRIYTIGFGVGSDSFAVATLMPTDANTATYRPATYSGDMRNRTQTMETPYYWRFNQWNESTYYSSRNNQTQYGTWTPFSGYSSSPANTWTSYTTDFSTQIDPFTANGYNYAYFLRTRTGIEFANIISNPSVFNEKYWENGSSTTSSSAQDLFDAFVDIVNELLIMKPNSMGTGNEYSDIMIEDILGDGFSLYGSLPSGLSAISGGYRWTLDGDDFNAMPPDETPDDGIHNPLDTDYLYSVTFQVKIDDDASPGTYYTNDNSSDDDPARTRALFNVSENNPFYTPFGDIIENLNNTGWLELVAPDVTVNITVNKTIVGPVTSVPRTFTFSVYDAPTGGNVVDGPESITITGAGSGSTTLTFDIPFNYFTTNQATFYVQENETTEPEFWTYQNDNREAVNITRANPTGSASFTNRYEPEGKLIVKKAWDGGTPENITFKLYKEIAPTVWVLVSSGHTITPNDVNGIPITGLALDTNYKVIEDFLQDYTPSYSPSQIIISSAEIAAGGSLTKTITINNEYKTPIGKIKVTKIWDDSDFNAIDRPSSLTFNISGPNGLTDTLTLYGPNWVDTYETEVFGLYTFTEVVPQDYQVDGNPKFQTILISPVEDREKSLTFSNTYVEPRGSLTVEKIWARENNDFAAYRPETITIKLYLDGADTGKFVILPENDATPWAYTFDDLDFGLYTVEEITVDDYTVTYSAPVTLSKHGASPSDVSTRAGKIEITNTFNNPKGTITVNKQWVESDVDISVVRPTSLTFDLYKGPTLHETVTLPVVSDTMSHSFTDLPLDGSVYTVVESSTDGVKLAQYEPSLTYGGASASPSGITLGPDYRSGTVTLINTYAKGTVTVIKDWDDGDNPDADLPPTAWVTLKQVIIPDPIPPTFEEVYNEETELMELIEVDPGNSNPDPIVSYIGPKAITRPASSVVFYDLPIGDNITYTVMEDSIPYYSTTFSTNDFVLNDNNQNQIVTVYNTYTNPKGQLTVTKGWEHGNNPNQPTEVTVELYENTFFKESKTFVGSHTFTELDLGKTYTIKEIDILNYTPNYRGFVSYTPVKGETAVVPGSALITNAYVPEVGDIEVIKDWKGNEEEEITVTLHRYLNGERDGTFVRTADLSASEDPELDWRAEFKGLELYGLGGVKYDYSVQESGDNLALYDAELGGSVKLVANQMQTLTITNTYSPNKGSLTITKEWLDAEGEPIDPEYPFIEVALVVNGVREDSYMLLDESNDWTALRSGLNVENTYSIEEITKFEEYETTHDPLSVKFDAENLRATITITNQRTIDDPQIEVTKTVSNSSQQLSGGTATFNYTVVLKNIGNRTLKDLTIIDDMEGPSTSTLTYNPVPNDVDETGVIYYLMTDLLPGKELTFNYSVTVNRVGSYENNVIGYGYFIEEMISDTDDASASVTETPTEPPSESTTEPPTEPTTAPPTTEPTTEEITEEDVPEGAPYDLDIIYAEPPMEELIEEETPLGEALPQTGQLPAELFYGIGGLISAAGVFMKKFKR